MAFQTSLDEFLVRSKRDGNINVFHESYPSPPPSPKYSTSSSEIKKEENEENLNGKLKGNNISNKLSKEVIPPNYSHTGRAGITQQVKRDFNFKNSGYATHCFVCENRVKPINLRCHLYFGSVKCEECGKVITSCLKFGNLNIPQSKGGGKCPHSKLDWNFPPVDNLKKLLDEDEETFDKSLIQYLESLKGLGGIKPFKDAIFLCNMYLKEKEYSRTNKFCELDETSSVTINNTITTILNHPVASASSIDKTIPKIKKVKTRTGSMGNFADNALSVKIINTLTPITTLHTASASLINITTPKIKKLKTRSGSKENFPHNALSVKINNTFTPITTLPTASVNFINKTTPKIKKPKSSSGSKAKFTNDILPVFPENGFYLIAKKAIEECPNCYEPIDIQDLKINTNNWLISTSCKGCSLFVYFLLDPPDGSQTKLKIIYT